MSPVKIYFVDTDGNVGHYMDSETSVRQQVVSCLSWLRQQLTDTGWGKLVDMDTAVDYVLSEFFLLRVQDSLIALSAVSPWFSTDVVLAEEFNAPFGDNPASVAEVVLAMEAMAKLSGCTKISLGTRANTRQRGLARLFEKEGARLSTIEFVKDIPYEQGYQECSESSS